MKILRALLDSLPNRDVPVRDVCTGAFWTLVTTKYSGLAATYRETDLQHTDEPVVVADAGHLTEKTAGQLAQYALSPETVAASIGVAAINSMLEIAESKCTPENAYEILAQKGAGKTIAVVGHFPFVPKLRDIAKQVLVLERKPRAGDFGQESEAEILARADVVCLTGSALINHTLDDLLERCRGKYVVLTGPSSPLTPLLFDFGINAICGARVTDPQRVKRFISQGACLRQLKGQGIQFLTLRAD